MKTRLMRFAAALSLSGAAILLLASGCGSTETQDEPAKKPAKESTAGTREGRTGTTPPPASPVAFERETYAFQVERDYEQRRALALANKGGKPVTVTLAVEGAPENLIVGFAGDVAPDATLDVPPGGTKSFDFVIHAQDASPGEHAFAVTAESEDASGTRTKARARVSVTVEGVDVRLEVTKGETDPWTLATTLRIHNQGETLTDLTLSGSGGLEGAVSFRPQVVHAKLEAGARMTVRVAPVLHVGYRRSEGEILFQAAGETHRVPLAFEVPGDKEVFCGVSRSVQSTSGSTWFCTNRPKVNCPLDLGGDGPAPSAPRNPISVQGPPVGPGEAPPEDGGEPPEEGDGEGPRGPRTSGPGSFSWAGEEQPTVESPGSDGPHPLDCGDPVGPGDTIHVPEGSTGFLEHEGGQVQLPPGDYTLTDEMFESPEEPGFFEGLWNEVSEKIEKIISTGDEDVQSAAIGVRGGEVRANVARLRPRLEEGNAREPFLLVRPSGRAAVWHSSVTGDQEIWFWKETDGKRAKPVRVTRAKGASRWPFLAGDLDGTLFLAWEDGRDGKGAEIYLGRSDDGGKTWGAPIRLTAHETGAFDPVVWAGGKQVVVAWEDARGGVRLVASTDGGASFGRETAVAEGEASWPQLAGTPGNLWCAFEAETDGTGAVFAARSTDGSATWSDAARVSTGNADAGEPSLLVLDDGSAAIAWRDDRHGASEIYVRRCDASGTWTGEVRVTEDDVYGEYPALMKTSEGLRLLFCAPAVGVNYRYLVSSPDGGATWEEPRRLPEGDPNVRASCFVSLFGLPWDRKEYKPHDVHVKINGTPVASLIETIPEGRYLFPFDPRLVRYGPGAENEVALDTVHLHGGHYVVSTDFSVLQRVTHQEKLVVAASQAEADREVASRTADGANHDAPDMALFTNRIEGMPEDRSKAGRIELLVEAINLGAATAENVTVRLARGRKGDGALLCPEVRLGSIAPWSARVARLPFAFDGTVLEAAVVVRSSNADADLLNDVWPFKLGEPETGTLHVASPGDARFRLLDAATDEPAGEAKANESLELPVGVYDLASGSGEVLRENVAVKGGEETRVDLSGEGVLTVEASGAYPVEVFPEGGSEPVASGKAGASFSLPAGFYRVDVDGGEAGAGALRDVPVVEGEENAVHVRVQAPPASRREGEVLFSEAFSDPASFEKRWTVHDTPFPDSGPSKWRVRDGALQQDSNIHRNRGEHVFHEGTHAVTRAGEGWTDYEFSADWRIRGDNDGVGFLFRYRDENHYYRFMTVADRANKGPFRRIQVKKGVDELVTIAETREAYDPDKPHTTRIRVAGDRIEVWLDDEKILSAEDTTYASGGVGFQCYAEQPVFDNVRVTAVSAEETGGAFLPEGKKGPGEPNDEPEDAGLVALGKPFEIAFEQEGDWDHVRVNAPDAGYLRVDVDGVPEDFALRFRFADASGKTLQESEHSNALRVGKGTYIVGLRPQWGETLPEPFRVTVSFTGEIDAFEPNNEPGSAKPMELGEVFDYAIYPRYDRDLFKVTVPGPGYLRIVHIEPVEGMAYRWWFGTASGEELLDTEHSNALRVEKGDYIAGFRDQWNERPGRLPRGKANSAFVREVDAFEPNNEPGSAKPMELGEVFDYAIYPRYDRDLFKVTVPGPGYLRIVQVEPVEGMAYRWWFGSASGEEILDTEHSNALRVEKGDYIAGFRDQWNEMPGSLQRGKAKFEFLPEMDRAEPNGEAGAAKRIRLGERIEIALYPKGDRDWFTVQAERKGTLILEAEDVPEGITLRFYIQDASGKVLGDSAGDFAVEVEPGVHKIMLRDEWGGASDKAFGVRFVMK